MHPKCRARLATYHENMRYLWEQAWWEKWGERYDTRVGNVFKWTDKWAESGAGIR